MGILLRGTKENFNPQIHTEANSLTSNMQKYMAVRTKSLDLFARYTKFTSFMYASGRYNAGKQNGNVRKAQSNGEGLMDNAYRIQYDGALILPAVSFGAAQIGSFFDSGNSQPDMTEVAGVAYTNGVSEATVQTNTVGSIAIKHDPEAEIYGDKFNPNDSIVLDSGLGLVFIITSHPRRSVDNTHYVLDGKFVGEVGLFKEDHLDEDNVFTEGGDYFGEGSLRGWQRYNRNKWRINYTSIHRSTVTMTGSAKKQKIQWVANSGDPAKRMWEYDAILKNDQLFHVKNELALRFSRISMDPTDHTWFENYGKNKLTLNGFTAESGLAAPILGNGWIPEIQDNFTIDYDPNTGLAVGLLESMLMVLGQRSPKGSSGNEFVGIGDKIGHRAIDATFKKLIGFGNNAISPESGTITNNIVNISTGKDNELGFSITKYYYLGNWFTFIEDELFNNPGLFPTNGGVTGTGNIYILNCSDVDGVSNFEMLARSGREFKRKYENGMHSFDESQDAGSVASSGFDGCAVHSLAEMMAILYDVRSCGILRASTKFNGGALAGNAAIANGAAQFLF